MPHRSSRSRPIALFLLTILDGATARAEPQASFGTTVGGAVTEMRAPDGPRGAFHLGFRGDVSFFRARERSMGFGPYIEVLTAGFDTLEVGSGASWLIPLVPSMPIVVSAGLHARRAPGFPWEPGAHGMLFFGSRGYNFHSWYGMANGVFVAPRFSFGDARQADLVLGVQLDLMLFALPVLFVVEGLRH